MMNTNAPSWRLGDILHTADPSRTALISGSGYRRHSYAELSGAADRLAAQLVAAGLSRGDVMVLQASNGPQFVVALIAAARAGVVVAPMDPTVPGADKRRRVEALGARVVLTDRLRTWDFDTDCPDWLLISDQAGLPTMLDAAAPPRAAYGPAGLSGDDALIMMTSGSTGAPKLVPWTHHNLAASITAIVNGYRLDETDATVAVMPLFHGHGLVAALLATMASGGTLLLPASGRFSAHTFWDDIAAAKATWYTAVPTIHRILLSRAAPGASYPPLRFIRSCSAPLSADDTAALESTFGTVVLAAYGMTETTHQASTVLAGDDIATRTHTVGRPSVVTARLNTSGTGEILLSGPTVVRGYLGAATESAAASFADGWFHTGDIGTVDDHGHLAVTGRIKNLINRGGEKIAPERVEAVLHTHPDITRAAVVGVPDDLYGERVAAVIVGAGSLSTAQIAEFCRTRLASYEIPEMIVFAADIAVTAKGDIDRAALPAQLQH